MRAEIVSGSYFPVLGARPAARAAHRSLGRCAARRASGGRALAPTTGKNASAARRTCSGEGPGQQLSDDGHRRRAGGLPRRRSARRARAVDSGRDDRAGGQPRTGWNRLLDRRAAWMHVFGRFKPGMTVAEGRRPACSHGSDRCSRPTPAAKDSRDVTAEQRRSFLASTLDLLPAPRGLSRTCAASSSGRSGC